MIYILMVVYEFPPLNSGGSHRPYKFAKNLHLFGIHPIIVTPEIDVHGEKNVDEGLFDDDQNMTVFRTPVDAPKVYDKLFETYYFNVVGTEAARWRHHCLAAVESVLKNYPIQALYVTAPPFSMTELGAEIARKHNLPFLVDMRDAWSHWVVSPYASYLHYYLTLRKERSALNIADAVVTTSEQTMLDFQSLHTSVLRNKFHVVTNAYDGLLPELQNTLTITAARKGAPLIIGYVGSFYYTPYQRSLIFKPWWKKKPLHYLQYVPRREDWLYRSPYFFFAALAYLREQLPNLADLLIVKFVGSTPIWLPEMIADFGLHDIVVLQGRVSHKEAMDFQSSVDALLITSSKVINGLDYSIAGKTFEYVCMNKPVLAFVCEGAQKKLLEKTGVSICCPPDDIVESARILSNLLNGYLKLQPDMNEIEPLWIKHTTERLASVIKGIIND